MIREAQIKGSIIKDSRWEENNILRHDNYVNLLRKDEN